LDQNKVMPHLHLAVLTTRNETRRTWKRIFYTWTMQ